MSRIPEYRLEESAKPAEVLIRLRVKGMLAHIWSGERSYGRIYPVNNDALTDSVATLITIVAVFRIGAIIIVVRLTTKSKLSR